MDYDGHNPPADREDEVHAAPGLDQLGQRAFEADQRRQDADNRSDRAQRDWAEAEAELDLCVFQGREQCESDQEFNGWLGRHGLGEMGKDDRAARINLGRYIDITKEVLRDTHLRSAQTIWRKLVSVRVLKDTNPAKRKKLRKDDAVLKEALSALKVAVQQYDALGEENKDKVRRKACRGFEVTVDWLLAEADERDEAKADDDDIEASQVWSRETKH